MPISNIAYFLKKILTCGVVFHSVDVLRTWSLHNSTRVASWPASSYLIRCGITIKTYNTQNSDETSVEVKSSRAVMSSGIYAEVP